MSDKSKENPVSLDIYRRLLKQKADTAQLQPFMDTVSGRLPTCVRMALRVGGFELDVRNGSTAIGGLASTGSGVMVIGLAAGNGTMPAALSIDFATAIRLVDFMLGGDPDIEDDTVEIEPGDLQRDLVIDFGALLCPAIEEVLKTDQELEPRFIERQNIGRELGDYVSFQQRFDLGSKSCDLDIVLSQTALLKVPQLIHKAAMPRATDMAVPPSKNVHVRSSGVVSVPGLTLGDVASMQAGHIVALTGEAAGETVLIANGRKLHKCRIGKDNNSYALLVEQPYEAMNEIVKPLAQSQEQDNNHEYVI